MQGWALSKVSKTAKGSESQVLFLCDNALEAENMTYKAWFNKRMAEYK